MDNGSVIGLGEVLWDLLPDGKKIGGAPANFACHMAQFGYASLAVSAVGRDALGDEAVAELEARGLRFVLERVEWPTGTVAVTLDGRGIPRYAIAEHVAWDRIPFTPRLEQLARGARCVCFGSLAQRSAVSRGTVVRFLDAMPAGALRVFDINLRQHFYDEEVVRSSMAKCNVLKINDEELVVVARMLALGAAGDPGRVCRGLMERFGIGTVILTCGERGSVVFSGAECSQLATPRVAVVDTVGAGDSFTAGFCAARLTGLSLGEAHRLAVDTSAFVCTQAGAMPQLPAELVARVRG